MDHDSFSIAWVVAGIAVYGAYDFVVKRRRETARDLAWRAAAIRLDATAAVEPRTFFRDAGRSMRLTVAGAPATLRAFTRKAVKSSVLVTSLEIGPVEGFGTVGMHVTPRSLVGRVARSLGVGGRPIGDARFQDAVQVTGQPHAVLASLFDHRLCDHVLELREPLEMDHGRLIIETDGHAEDADLLVGMVRYARPIVRRCREMIAAPVRVADALGLEHRQAPFDLAFDETANPIARGLRRGKQLTLSVRQTEERLVSVVTIDKTADEGGPVELVFDLEPNHEELVFAVDAALDASHGAYR